MLVRVVVAVNDAALRRRLTRLGNEPDVVVQELRRPAAFWRTLRHENADLVLASLALLPESVDQAIDDLRALPDQPELVVLTSREDPEGRASLIAEGCLAVVNTDLPDRALHETLVALIEKRRETALDRFLAERPEEQFRLGDFVSKSPRMQKFVEVASKVVDTDSSILVLGETGVGKERLARAIHAEGRRARGPFVVVNCGAVPESLWESELFGHEEGAFTGAVRPHRGYFEIAHGGTIFLDEIGDMPPNLQVKLLRVLQERKIQRLGSEQPLTVSVRVMAATNRNLLADMKEKRFRSDLYYRLSVVTLEIPPLRERQEDIPGLVESYLETFSMQLNRRLEGITGEALQALVEYDWPGNVRELMNVIERAVLLSEDLVTLEDLPEAIVGDASPEGRPEPVEAAWRDMPLAEARRLWIEFFERRYLERLLRATRGRIGETADRAGIDPRSLYDKMKAHGLRKEDFRA